MKYLESTIDDMLSYCKNFRRNLIEGRKRTAAHQKKNLILDDRYGGYYKIIDPDKNNGTPVYRGSFEKDPEVQKVAAYHYFDSALEIVEENIRLLEKCKEEIRDIDPNVFLETMPKAYQKQANFVFDMMGVPDIDNWMNMPRRYSERFPEDKKYLTKQKWMVRSKSEVMWSNAYYDRGIPCLYEAVQPVNGINIATDFRALETFQYEELSHEHFGKMDDLEYVTTQFLPKLKAYLKAGFIPGVNLIMTFEFGDTPLTPEVIQATLDHYYGKQ